LAPHLATYLPRALPVERESKRTKPSASNCAKGRIEESSFQMGGTTRSLSLKDTL
jgi:hypothetical protein